MLRDALNVRSSDTVLFRFKRETLTVSQGMLLPYAYGRVAVSIDQPLELARSILALDGSADRVVLVPPELPVETVRLLMQRADVDRFVSRFTELQSGKTAPATVTEWILATSGTTGKPKLVRHSMRSLTRLTVTDAARGGELRWGMLYDMTRFAGYQVFLQAVLGGSELILTQPDEPLSVKIRELSDAGCSALSATPTLWRKILMSPESHALPLRQITLGGEIVDHGILSALASCFPEARLTQIYASTEAGAAFSVTDGREGFPVDFLYNPPKGVELRIVQGRLFVRNPLVHPHYVGDQRRFVDADGFVDTGDLVAVKDDRVYFLGRKDGSINVGGNKVHPEEVETVLLSHPDVRLARVYGVASPITGQLVAAEVVPTQLTEEDSALLQERLKGHCAARLDRYKRPAWIRIVPELMTEPSGKISRSPVGGAQ